MASLTYEDGSRQGHANVGTPSHKSSNEEVELRTRQHQPTRVDEDRSNLCQNAGNGHPRRGGSVSGSTSSGWVVTGNPRVSPPRGDAGTPAIEADRGNVIDPLSGEGEALQRVQLKTPGQLGGEQVTLTSRVGESQGGSVAETRRLQKTHCETTSIAEAGKLCGDGLRVKPRDYGCEHDAILHIGEECCDKGIELPLYEQVQKLREEIRKLKEENLRFQLAEAMEQCTNHGSQPHGQDTILLHQENASLKEKVVMLEIQLAGYKEDFATERKDREKAVENTEKIKSELKTLQKDLEQHKILLEDMETAIGVQTQNCKQMLRELKEKLEAAKEEIAVKVAQVKQYQKQVEAYKGQVAQHVTNEEAQKEAFETLIIEIDKGKTRSCTRNTNDEQAATGAELLTKVSADGCPDPHQSLDTALNPVGHNEESSSVGTGALLPSPNGNPRQPLTSPACLDSGIASLAPVCDTNKSQEAVPIQVPGQVHIPSHVPVQNHSTLPSSIPIPISGRHDNHMSTAPHLDSNIVIGSVDDGSNLPLPMMLPRKRLSLDSQEQAGSNWEKPGGSEPQAPRRVPHVRRPDYVSEGDLCADISEDIHAEAERVVGGATRGMDSALNTCAPLDPNLQCICCGWMFRKGEIQIFKKHVLECTRRGNL